MLLNTDGHVWVHNKQAWKPVSNLDKDYFRFGECDLFGASTIMRSDDKALNPSDKIWKSPNGEWGAVYQKKKTETLSCIKKMIRKTQFPHIQVRMGVPI